MKDLSECRILIVDDVADNVEILVNTLRGEHKLSVARDGESALRLVETNPPDLVLLDIMMPGMDGYEVCRRLRASEANREMPIVFLSALDEVTHKTRGFELGANDYLTKPFEPLEVKARVRSLLRAKAYGDAVREAAEREMGIAREIQHGLLPADVSAAAAGSGLEIHAVMEPARQIGGDFFEVLRAGEGRLVVAIADVMGKGVPAALFMAMSMTLLRSLAKQHAEPPEILRRLNDELVAYNPRRLFVTMSCLQFEGATGVVSGASAGHCPLVLIPRNGEPRLVLRSSGPVLGILPQRTYGGERLELAAGDQLVLYSDGVTEAERGDDEQFGDERLLRFLASCQGAAPAGTVDALLAEVRRFANGAPQNDDITILAIRRS